MLWPAATLLFVPFVVGCNSNEPDTSNSVLGESSETSTDTSSNSEAKAEETPMPEDDGKYVLLETDKGNITVKFFPEKAPLHVANFKELVKSGFYDGTRFHRCIPGFMVQCGDPKSKDLGLYAEWGTGGNMIDGLEKNVKAEFNDIDHKRGILSMARSQSPDSGSSQFFIMQADSPGLNGQYSAFGEVVSGMDVVDKIVVTGDPNDNGKVKADEAIVLKKATIIDPPAGGSE
ncbi:MAG: peptidylprolyl isomerase [Armatimonadetes bacterium]|nr:peptidylprolyl isomerase [Armatimonadota bacterium]